MAYSNWGAFVYRNGERRTDKEDVGVFDTDEASVPSAARIFVNILKRREKGNDEWHGHSHHAVLGDGAVRLCGYKDRPELWMMADDGLVSDVKLKFEHNDVLEESGEVETPVGKWMWSYSHDGENMIDLELTEPDGTTWTSRCGYCYGAGHTDVENDT